MKEQRKQISDEFGGPVKHEARLKLWLPALEHLKNTLGGKYLKYFTLSGPNAYDVILWKEKGLLEYNGRGFPNVRFCGYDASDIDEATSVLGNTVGINARFEDMILKPYDAKYQAFWDFLPCDVYNLDFCGSWFKNNEPPVSDTFQSIIELINEHVNKEDSGEFLLLLTIRIDKNATNRKVINALKSNLKYNSRNKTFSQIIKSLVAESFDDFVNNSFRDFMLISIPKLIAYQLTKSARRWTAKLVRLDRAFYHRYNRDKGYSYYIGKFVFLIGKEESSLQIKPAFWCPSWYPQFVNESLKLIDIMEIMRDRIPDDTEKDLEMLKNAINAMRNHV